MKEKTMNGLFILRRGIFVRIIFGVLFVLALIPSWSKAQDDKQLRVQIANLVQDVNLLRSQMGQLNQEIARLSRENAQLKASLKAQSSSQLALSQSFVDLAQLNQSINNLRHKLESADTELKKDIIKQVNAQVDELGTKFNSAIKALADSMNKKPSVLVEEFEFSDDYPKTGIPYEVKPGDSLSKIAREYNSTVRDIQNANKIARPSKDLQVGQTIFIPQRK